MGSGGTTVILDAGLGEFSLEWYQIQAALGPTVRSCAFDRAGFGFSDAPPQPQTIPDVAKDMHDVLRAAGIRPPYVMVGHSLGGIEVRMFAVRWPGEVAGMVLVDSSYAAQKRQRPTLPGYDAAQDNKLYSRSQICAEAVKAGPLQPGTDLYQRCIYPSHVELPPALQAIWPSFARVSAFENMDSLDKSLDDVAAADRLDFKDKPLIVLTAGETNFPANSNTVFLNAWRQKWIEAHVQLTKLSSRGIHEFVQGSDHQIVYNKPEVVLSAILRVEKDIAAQPARP
jgi:pimeloyl-ACP methyl ester carboxylesterase